MAFIVFELRTPLINSASKGGVIHHLGNQGFARNDITAGRAGATGAGGSGIGRQFVDVRWRESHSSKSEDT